MSQPSGQCVFKISIAASTFIKRIYTALRNATNYFWLIAIIEVVIRSLVGIDSGSSCMRDTHEPNSQLPLLSLILTLLRFQHEAKASEEMKIDEQYPDW
jgi:hypothetical protein